MGMVKAAHQLALGTYITMRMSRASEGIYAYWRELLRTQWLSREEIERLQVERLHKLLLHAQDHCAFYRERFSWLASMRVGSRS